MGPSPLLAPDVGSSAREMALLARRLYRDGPVLMRKMTHHRIRICPFECLVPLVPAGSTVLDAGCGSGLFLALLAHTVPGVDGVGFDSSSPAIETARRMADSAQRAGLRARLRFLHLDLYGPWPPGGFDVVSLIDVLHHVPPARQQDVFEQAIRCVKPGGLLLYKDMAARPLLCAALNRLHDLLLARQWVRYIPIRRAEAWAAHHGLTCVHAGKLVRYWYHHDLRVFRKPLNAPEPPGGPPGPQKPA